MDLPSRCCPAFAASSPRNPGPMTYHGTNTYLIDGPEGIVVLDPGPDRPEHIQAILSATGERCRSSCSAIRISTMSVRCRR